MIILAKDGTTGAMIFKYDKNDVNPIFRIDLGGYSYSHSVRGTEEDSYNWYCGVLGRQFTDLYERSLEEGKTEVQKAIRSALDLK